MWWLPKQDTKKDKPVLQYHYTCLLLKHALSTPLMVLQDSVNQLETEVGGQQFKQITSSIYRLQSITEQLLKPELNSKINLVMALQEVVALLANSKNTIRCIDLTPKSTKIVTGHSLYLQEAVICLVVNALAAYSENEERVVILSIKSVTKNVVVTVSDFGMGFKSAQKKGVGLKFARWVVTEKFGGTFYIDSKKDLGTRVQCSFTRQE